MTENILGLLAGLAGLGTLVSVVVNLLKVLGVVKDGTSEMWVQGLNLGAFIAVSIVYFIGVEVNWGEIDSYITFAATFFGLVVQLLSSKITYSVTQGTPLGYSFSNQDK